jgi:hypothetical protein
MGENSPFQGRRDVMEGSYKTFRMDADGGDD